MSVDAHCHIDLHSDPKAIVASAVSDELKVVAVTTTPAAFKISSTFSNAERSVYPALGMHPEVVGSRPNDVTLFSNYLEGVKWVGEIGLDGSRRFRGFWEQQVSVFNEILAACASAGGKLMSIHSRSASSEVLGSLAEHPEAGTPVLHWFSGTLKEVSIAIELGAFFSVNEQMLQSKSGQAIVGRIPLGRLLTETDSPFACVSSDNSSLKEQILACEHLLGEIYKLPQQRIQDAIDANFEQICESLS